jgi:crotonobetainyl-CoA:carnitine CoA-transferase CaiB-like acyl-CoA transferase
VVEVADEQAEYCGLLLAGLGAEVVKVEPPGGNGTRRIGPFLDDIEGPERSLHFWHYNRGKRSVVLEFDDPRFARLVATADVVLDSTPRGTLGLAGFRAADPALVTARITPFGDTGPWADWTGSDLVHLALGGPMMNCGYDPTPDGRYDLPPIAPQMWQSYHITGEQTAMAIVAALFHRRRSGEGQHLSCAVHEAVAKCTELDLMNWVMRAAPLHRQTCRHAAEAVSPVPTIAHTKDGRWLISAGLTLGSAGEKLLSFLDNHGMGESLRAEADRARASGPVRESGRPIPGSGPPSDFVIRCQEALQRLFAKFTYDTAPWREAQELGLMIAPLRRPEENLADEHWRARRTFSDIEHPELGRSFTDVTGKWIATDTAWVTGRRAPLLDEDAALLEAPDRRRLEITPRLPDPPRRALEGIRVFDFSWFLASAGGTRFLAALGAEVIKVEWHAHPDTRMGAMAPVGGRAARAAATGPLPPVDDPDMGGQFHNKNTGKRGISLNVRHPRGLEIAKALIARSDIVAEGFSPGVLDRWGLGWDELRRIRPDIIYAQQSGMGSAGTYGRFRSVGPVAAAFAGSAELSGLPAPAMPAGWGYSYLDWLGAYSFALAMLTALHHRDRTGVGQYIDASQCEAGLFANGTTYLDHSAHGRSSARTGNRSPYLPAAPHGAYPTAGVDRWIAIACFDEPRWAALRTAARGALDDPRFATLADRLARQDELDATVSRWTRDREGRELMAELQAAGVPAGVCQTAADRVDLDPQLAHLNWLTEVTGTRIGTWPVAEVPVKLSATPATVAGPTNRGAPGYGEDNAYVYGELLGLSDREIEQLRTDGVI